MYSTRLEQANNITDKHIGTTKPDLGATKEQFCNHVLHSNGIHILLFEFGYLLVVCTVDKLIGYPGNFHETTLARMRAW